MIKKIFLGLVLAGVSGALVFGAINRTNLIIDKNSGTTSVQSIEGNQGNGGNQRNSKNSNSELEHLNENDQRSENQNSDGYGKNRKSAEAVPTGYQGNQSGNGQGINGGEGNNGNGNPSAERSGDNIGEAANYAEDWLTLEGIVSEWNSEDVLVILTDNSQYLLEGRAWSFAQENGFSLDIGDGLVLRGFYEDEDFEVGSIHNLSDDQYILLRDENGRPMWAGNGRWN